MQIYKPTRMCIACRMKTNKDELLRFIFKIDREIADITDNEIKKNSQEILCRDKDKKEQGRGYYLCQACFEKGLLSKIKIKKPKNKKV